MFIARDGADQCLLWTQTNQVSKQANGPQFFGIKSCCLHFGGRKVNEGEKSEKASACCLRCACNLACCLGIKSAYSLGSRSCPGLTKGLVKALQYSTTIKKAETLVKAQFLTPVSLIKNLTRFSFLAHSLGIGYRASPACGSCFRNN